VSVPRVAELPTCQKMPSSIPSFGPRLINLNQRVAGGRERAPDLENPERIVVALSIEGECSGQLSRRIKAINAGCECDSAQILTRQVGIERHACQAVVCGGEIALSLGGDPITGVYGASGHEAR